MVLSFDGEKYGVIEKLGIETQKKLWKETGNEDLLGQSGTVHPGCIYQRQWSLSHNLSAV